MPTLHVCPLSRLSSTVAGTGAGGLITLVNAATPVERPKAIEPGRHLLLYFNDIVEPREGLVLPSETHVSSLLDFARSWDRRTPLLINCYAGISRSTAGLYIAACALRPDWDEREIALRLRKASPSATPNRLLIAIADRLLERDGRMVAAIAEIGRGAEAFEGEPFGFDLI